MNPRALIAIVLLVVAVTILVMFNAKGDDVIAARLNYAYFYDVAAGEIVVEPSDKIPPFQTQAGGEAVAAVVYSCTTCTDVESRFIGWLVKYTDEGKQRIAERQADVDNEDLPPMEDDPQVQRHKRIAAKPKAGKDIKWFKARSPRAEKLMQSVLTHCEGGAQRLVACAPTPAEVK